MADSTHLHGDGIRDMWLNHFKDMRVGNEIEDLEEGILAAQGPMEGISLAEITMQLGNM